MGTKGTRGFGRPNVQGVQGDQRNQGVSESKGPMGSGCDQRQQGVQGGTKGARGLQRLRRSEDLEHMNILCPGGSDSQSF